MSDDAMQYEDGIQDDGRAALAMAIGLAAAIAAGGLWAVLVTVTSFEIGYAAWGVGLLVGLAMSRVTVQRTQRLALAAALFAFIGLAAGKAFIFASSADEIAEAFITNDEYLGNAVAWQMYAERSLDEETLQAVDALSERNDTLSDALWSSMQQQAAARIAGMSAEEREEAAQLAVRGTMQAMGMLGGIRAQLSLFDMLWIFLAVGTAYRMLAPPKEQHAAAEV